MKTSCLLAALSFLLLTGCNDQSPSPGNSRSNQTAPADSAKPAAKRPRKPIDLAAINRAVEKFYLQEGRFPKRLTELTEREYLQTLPDLPDGLSWDYDTNTGVVSITRQ